jgi:tetratricopeptide (TPR) repeat protein
VAPSKRRRLLRAAIVLALLGALAGAGIYLRANRPRIPPVIDLTDADPAVAASVEEARAAVLRAPRSGDRWGKLGMVLLANSFPDEAVECLAEAERLASRDMRWPYYRGTALMRQYPDEAIAAFRRAVQVGGPEATAPRLRLAELLLAQGDAEEAEEWFREVLEQEPGNVHAELGLGRVACARGAWSAGLPHLRRAAESRLTRQAASAQLAELYERLGDSRAAADAARRAQQLPPGPEPPDILREALGKLQVGRQARLARASRLLKDDHAADAVKLLSEVVRDHPESASSWLGLGRALLKQRRLAEARRALEQAARLSGDLVEVQFYLGVVLFEQGQPAEAATLFRRATQLRGDHGLAWYNLGHCLKATGDTAGAVKAFTEAVRYKPHHAAARIELAELLARSGRRTEALAELDAAVKLGADDRRAWALRRELLKKP